MKKSDFKIEITKGSGPGGQHRNKVESCVKITHIPTGLSEKCEDTPSQIKNLKIARKRILEKINNHKRELSDIQENKRRKNQINNGDRSFRRRTYDYKRMIVKDHITGKEAPLERIMNGELDLLR